MLQVPCLLRIWVRCAFTHTKSKSKFKTVLKRAALSMYMFTMHLGTWHHATFSLLNKNADTSMCLCQNVSRRSEPMRASDHDWLGAFLHTDCSLLGSSPAVMPGAAQGVFCAACFSHQAPAALRLSSLLQHGPRSIGQVKALAGIESQ